jgi:hypothetical protein
MLTSCTKDKKHDCMYVYRCYIMGNKISMLQSIVSDVLLSGGDSGFVASKCAVMDVSCGVVA